MAKSRNRYLARLRTYTGFLSVWVLHAGAFGGLLAALGWGGKREDLAARSLCTPGFACHGCPWATFACPIGVMAHGSAARVVPVLAVGFVLAVGALAGRLMCGFFCPFGWLQDLLYKIPTPKFELPKWTRGIKYLALALLVFALPFLLGLSMRGYLRVEKPGIDKTAAGDVAVTVTVENRGETPVEGVEIEAVYRDAKSGEEVYRSPKPIRFDVTVPPGERKTLPPFEVPNRLGAANLSVVSPQQLIVPEPRYDLYYCKVCPVGTLTAHIPGYFAENPEPDGIYGKAGRNALRLGVLGLFLVLMVFCSRAFCRLFCPLGAAYGLCARHAVTRVEVDPQRCTQCGLCDRACPVDLDVRKEAGGAECIACGDCIRACPQGAIRRRIGL